MKSLSGKRIVAIVVVCSMLLIPAAANAGLADIITLITTITSTLENSIGTVLGGIQMLNTTVHNFRQQVLFPVTLINQAKAFVGQVRAQFSTLAGQIHAIEISSATLVTPQQLESLLRHGQSGGLAQIKPAFDKLYTPLPLPSDAPPGDRNLMDADDAMAVGSLKTAVISDQATAQMLGVADGIEQQVATAAPGSAPMLTAQAQVANLQNQAMLQRMLAAELRQEATRLAHSNTLRKRSAEATRQLRDHMQQILTRP
ncbi:MAG TPA: hypothetical protein VF532_07655 [Candidatus Angelobacter sp.]